MNIIKGGVSRAKGFRSNGIHCGIKAGKKDLALIVSDAKAIGAAVFTKNSVKAAPVIVSQKHMKSSKLQAIVANSGNANCFTGDFGYIYADRTTESIGKLLNIPKTEVLVCSTGIIGKALPFKKIQKNAKKLVANLKKDNDHKTAQAILTTDTCTKEIAVSLNIGGKKVTIGGCSKGSGMIDPNMATMLSFITTDVTISSTLLKSALKDAVNESFNCITVDGCMSTNDTVAIMANGQAKNQKIIKKDGSYKKFYEALKFVCVDLAKKIVLDGEGSTKFIAVKVSGAKNFNQAQEVALKVANSNLVKTAVFGSNPNWGRVAAAVGSVGIKSVTEKTLRIDFSSFKKKEVSINIDLGIGKQSATVYTSDLSYEYVKINVEYN